jgi:hypothetical protein
MLFSRFERRRRLRLVVLLTLLALATTIFVIHLQKQRSLEIDFSKHERHVFSQNGEDGVIETIFEVIQPTSKFCIEFGGGDGVSLSNARNLILSHGWRALLIEGDPNLSQRCQQAYQQTTGIECLHHWVYPGNVETLFERHGVPADVDFLVIDIDSFDYYVWKVMHLFRPKVVMIEINGLFAPPIRAVVEYSPFLYWDKTFYYGASLQSMYELGRKKGYELIYVESQGMNAFFVDAKYFGRFGIRDNSPRRLYRPHKHTFSITESDLPNYVDEKGYIRSNISEKYFSNAPIKWDSRIVDKRWIMER